MSKTPIQLSDHFTCRKLICFTLPSITMIIFTAIYGVVDGFFVSNYAGKTPFAAVNLIIPVLLILGSVGFMFGTGGGHRHQPVHRRRGAADLLRPAQQQPAAAGKVPPGPACPGKNLLQRLLGVYEQRVHVPGEHAV